MANNIIINNILKTSIERNTADIKKWLNAIKMAENTESERRQPLVDLYKISLLDAHLSGVIDKRKSAILNTNIACGADGNENEFLTNKLNTPEGLELQSHILDTLFYGHTLLELTFADGDFLATLIPRRHVLPINGKVVLDLSDYDKFVNYRDKGYLSSVIEITHEDLLGLLSKTTPMVIYKRNCLGDFAQYAEIYGQPLRKITYDPSDPAAFEEARRRAADIDGSSPVTIMPKNADVEFIESANKSGSVEVYKSLISTANAEISKVILGNTLTTEQGERGARSLGEVHQSSEEQLILRDRIFLLNILNHKIKPLLQAGGIPIKEDEFFYFKEVEEMDLQKRIAIDTQLNTLIPIPQSYFYETYNIPKPQGAEPLAGSPDPLEGGAEEKEGTKKENGAKEEKKKAPETEKKEEKKQALNAVKEGFKPRLKNILSTFKYLLKGGDTPPF